MGASPCADAADVAASAKMEGFVPPLDFQSAALGLLSEHIVRRENSGSYRAPGFYEDALPCKRCRCTRRLGSTLGTLWLRGSDASSSHRVGSVVTRDAQSGSVRMGLAARAYTLLGN